MSNTAFRAACLAGAAICASMPVAVAAAPAGQTIAAYDLPAQDLGDRLRAISHVSGREIIFPAESVAGRRAPPLRGRFTFDAALRAALAGTGLVAQERAGAVLIRPPHDAQDETAPQPESITVTGTRIRGGGGAAPVIVTTRHDLEQAGVTDLAGYARLLPQNFTGGQNPGIAGGGQQGGQNNVDNSATLNLRGLGPDATLTLVNGHRLAYDALNQGVDISAIPLAAVERIEVVADGASALYGSDAVGGVANIILRRDFDGVQLSARFGGATDGGDGQQQYGAIAGGRWGSGGFMVAADFLHAGAIVAGQRDYTRTLDPGASLLASQAKLSLVIAGHQQLARGVELELDGTFSHRRSTKATPFFATSDVFANGLFNRPEVDSYAITPALRLALPAGWEARIGGTHAISRAEIFSRRFLGGAETPQYLIYANRLNALEATAEGPLFALPGGSARLAFGGGLRSVLLDVNVSRVVNGARLTTRDFTEKRAVQFAYGELSLPLIGPDNDVPLVEQLRLSAAARYERYAGIDAVTTPKLTLVYQPVRDLTFRLSWGRSFKVPTLNQVNQAQVGNLVPASLFSPQPEPPLPPDAALLQLSGGNPDLRAERATSWNAGLEFRPRFVPGLRLQATWFDIDYRDRISSPFSGTSGALANPAFRDFVVFNPSAAQVQALIAALPQGLINQTGAPFDPANVAAIVNGTLQNISTEHARGVDLAADYRLDAAGGALDLFASATYLDSARRISADQPPLQRAGIIFNPPHWRWRAGGSWSRGPIEFSTFLSYVGSTLDDRFADRARIAPFVTLDASLSIRSLAAHGPLHGVELRLSALNLLDEAPAPVRDLDPAAPPYDSVNQSAVGRFVSLSIVKSW